MPYVSCRWDEKACPKKAACITSMPGATRVAATKLGRFDWPAQSFKTSLRRHAKVLASHEPRMRPMPEINRFVRFAHEGSTAYGLLIKDSVNELKGPPFQAIEPTGRSFPLSHVRLLTPCEPSKVLAVGLNYASHHDHVEKAEGVFVTVSGRPAPS